MTADCAQSIHPGGWFPAPEAGSKQQAVSANSVLQSADFIAVVCMTADCAQSIHPEGWVPAPEAGSKQQAVSANTVLQSADCIAAVCMTAGCTQSFHPGGWFPAPEAGSKQQAVSANSVLQSADCIAAVCMTAGCRQSIYPEGWVPAPEAGGMPQIVAATAANLNYRQPLAVCRAVTSGLGWHRGSGHSRQNSYRVAHTQHFCFGCVYIALVDIYGVPGNSRMTASKTPSTRRSETCNRFDGYLWFAAEQQLDDILEIGGSLLSGQLCTAQPGQIAQQNAQIQLIGTLAPVEIDAIQISWIGEQLLQIIDAGCAQSIHPERWIPAPEAGSKQQAVSAMAGNRKCRQPEPFAVRLRGITAGGPAAAG